MNHQKGFSNNHESHTVYQTKAYMLIRVGIFQNNNTKVLAVFFNKRYVSYNRESHTLYQTKVHPWIGVDIFQDNYAKISAVF